CTQKWRPRPGSNAVAGDALAPSGETRKMGLFTARANRIVPSAPHAPCAMSGTSTIVSGVPPECLIFFSFPPAQKPMNCESGDQKGNSAPSVFSSFLCFEELSSRIHKELSPDASVAAKANISPLGESAMYSN